jgi:two-component system chemotaxis response regulator CheY
MSLNVIVVDDSATMRLVIGRALRMTGLPIGRIDEAGDGAEALAALRANVFDLAMVDINMPTMDGMALLDAVARDATLKHLPIIVVSTEASETRTAALQARGVGFVRKPFDPEKLLDAVVRAIGGAP